jgi:heme A synthase
VGFLFTFTATKKNINMIKQLHSGWAYVTLIVLIIAFVTALVGFLKHKSFKDTDLRIALFALIAAHIQLVLGFINYYVSPYYHHLRAVGMSTAMKEPETRLFVVEHPLMMILAIVLITIGFSKHKKKTTDAAKFKTIAIFYGIALLFVLSKIPWHIWFSQL